MTLFRPLAAALMATASPALALPASAANLTITDIVVGTGPIALTIPRIEVVDGNMTEADIRSAFRVEDLAATANSVSSWDAASIRIPEMSFSQIVKSPDKPETTAETVYRNLTIDRLQDGIAQSLRLEGGEMKMTGPETLSASFGPMSSGMIDFGAMVGIYAGGGGEAKTIYKDFVAEGGKLTGPEGVTCDIGKVAVGEFKARPLRTSLFDFALLAQSLEGGKTPSPAEIQTLVGFYTDMFQGMDVSPVTGDGMTCKLVDEKGQPISFSVGKTEFEGLGKGRYGAITLNDFDVTVADQGFMRAGKLVFKGVDLNGVLDALNGAGGELSDAWFEQNFRKLIPSFEGFALENMSIDIPDPGTPGQRVKTSIGAFDVTLKAYQLGIPTDISITAERQIFELPTDATDEGLRQLRDMGFDRIEADGVTKLHWDEASGTIVIDELSFSGVDMGSFNITGVVGNARKELFAEDPQLMQMAAMGLSIKEVTVSTNDDGLAEKVFTMVGKEQGQDPAAVRTQISGLAAGMVPMMLGGTEQAQQVANAVMTFLNGGTSLKITAIAKDAAGLGFVDFMAAEQNPAALVEKIDLSAEAQ